MSFIQESVVTLQYPAALRCQPNDDGDSCSLSVQPQYICQYSRSTSVSTATVYLSVQPQSVSTAAVHVRTRHSLSVHHSISVSTAAVCQYSHSTCQYMCSQYSHSISVITGAVCQYSCSMTVSTAAVCLSVQAQSV